MNTLAVFYQQGPAETTSYLIAGYVVIFGIMAVYLASLWVRGRNLHQELELLDEIADSEQKTPRKTQEDRS